MNFDIIFQTSRKFVLELKEAGKYFAPEPYEVHVNGELLFSSNQMIQTVEGLWPDTEYSVQLKTAGGMTPPVVVRTDKEYVTLDVRRFGARGDGQHDDTVCIQAAINACPPDSRVYIPRGVYRVSCLLLKSDITLDIDREATLSAFTEPERLPILPGLTESWDETEEYNLGTWEGNPHNMYGSVLTGIRVKNVVITGGGTVDGNASYENWWKDSGRKPINGAFRPRLVFLNHCENITVHGLTFQNAPAWTLHPYFSNHTRWLDLRILNPKVSPNTDGMDPESVQDIEIAGVYFSLGDDCIAMKSGKYYMGNLCQTPSQGIEIRQCYMRHGHGSVTLGSELAAGIQNLHCHDCLFEDTDRGLRVKTRRGRGNLAVLDNIVFENIHMDGVLTPFVVNSFYHCCDPDGRSQYVSSKEPLPVDKRTPFVKSLLFRNIKAVNCHVAASFLYGLPEAKVEDVRFENVEISFADKPIAEYPAMMQDLEPCTHLGLYINNVQRLCLRNVRVQGAKGKAVDLHNVDEVVEE